MMRHAAESCRWFYSCLLSPREVPTRGSADPPGILLLEPSQTWGRTKPVSHLDLFIPLSLWSTRSAARTNPPYAPHSRDSLAGMVQLSGIA
jgi:hypothetical protein